MSDQEIREKLEKMLKEQVVEFDDDTIGYFLNSVDRELLLQVLNDGSINMVDFDRYIILQEKLNINNLDILIGIESALYERNYEVLEMSDQEWPSLMDTKLAMLEIALEIIELQPHYEIDPEPSNVNIEVAADAMFGLNLSELFQVEVSKLIGKRVVNRNDLISNTIIKVALENMANLFPCDEAYYKELKNK